MPCRVILCLRLLRARMDVLLCRLLALWETPSRDTGLPHRPGGVLLGWHPGRGLVLSRCPQSVWFETIQVRWFYGFAELWNVLIANFWKYCSLAGHPRSGCPARLRGHKGSGLWKVWTVPSPPLPSPPLPSPPLPSPPSPALPCPALPCPALPCPALPCPPPPLPSPPLPSPPLPSPPSPPSPPSLPPSRVPNLIKLGPAVWPKLQPAEARECSAALAISEWTRRLSAMLIIARRKILFWKRRITRAVIRIGTNEWPIAHPTG